MEKGGAVERIIHQIWMQGFDQAPEYARSNSHTIREMHPKWQYMFWDSSRIESLAATNAEWCEKYASFTLLHQRVDFAKLLILYTFGGIVIDADAYTIRPLDSLFDAMAGADMVVSNVRRAPLPFGWIQNFFACGSTEKCMNNGSYIAKARSHVLAYLIRELVKLPSCASGASFQCVQQTTGPQVFHTLVNRYILDSPHAAVVVLESDVLEPCLGSLCEVTDRTYVVHKHAMTWCGPVLETIVRAYLACPHLYHALFFVAVLAIVARLFPARTSSAEISK